jgi:hypothetical protein
VEEDIQEMVDRVGDCSAMGDVIEDQPWDASNTQVAVTCTTEADVSGFCTGRRPLGHHEAPVEVVSVGTWLAVHAHLERASVDAFEQLAVWLARRGAPEELYRRCVAAAREETRHAEVMSQLARAAGVDVPPVSAEPDPDQGLFEVALHNAVEGCVHEAFAAIVALHQAEHAEDPVLREVYAEIAREELEHGQLAWDLHAWLLRQLSQCQRERVSATQAAAVEALGVTAVDNARRTPRSMGWPAPERAAVMAREFARRIYRSP